MADAPLHDVRATPYGGRGAYALQKIPQGTLVHSCPAPYASVILRKFRKEVCNWCFAYSFEKGKRKWDIKLDDTNIGGTADDTHSNKKSKTKAAPIPVYFCSERCLQCWVGNYDWGGEGGGIRLWLDMNSALERTFLQEVASSNKGGGKPTKLSTSAKVLLEQLNSFAPSSATKENISTIWRQAELVFSDPKQILPTLRQWTKDSGCPDSGEFLTEFEVDGARFILDGLFRRSLEDLHAVYAVTGESPRMVADPGPWEELLKLQDNETNTLNSKPSMMLSFIRVYAFVKHVVYMTAQCPGRSPSSRLNTPSTPGSEISATSSNSSRGAVISPLLGLLLKHLSTCDTTRALIARDHTNVFGIWEEADDGVECEMLGWGMFVSAACFNHDCSPNVKKRRNARGMEFVTTRDVAAGEELCTNYIDVDEGSTENSRNKELEEEWFFKCRCSRCERERADDAGK